METLFKCIFSMFTIVFGARVEAARGAKELVGNGNGNRLLPSSNLLVQQQGQFLTTGTDSQNLFIPNSAGDRIN